MGGRFQPARRAVGSIVLLLGAFAVAPAASGAQEAAISGTVTDTTGLVLAGVTVEARSVAGEQVGIAVTDGTGVFASWSPAPTR